VPGDRGAEEHNGEHESPPSDLAKREALTAVDNGGERAATSPANATSVINEYNPRSPRPPRRRTNTSRSHALAIRNG
jgi:hypothetical protein